MITRMLTSSRGTYSSRRYKHHPGIPAQRPTRRDSSPSRPAKIPGPGGDSFPLAEQPPGRDGAEHDRTAFLYRHADRVCGYLCLASRLITRYRSPSAGYRGATDEERVIKPCIMVVWVAAQLRRYGIARQLVHAAARRAGITPSGLGWAEPFTDSGYLLAQSIAPDGMSVADYG